VSQQDFDTLSVLEAAKDIEARGQAFYEEAAKAVSDEKVKSMFLTLAQEEVRHSRALEATRKLLAETFPTFLHEVHGGNLTTRFADLLFPEAPSSILSDTSTLTEIQALERGIQLERESIELYEDAAEKERNPGASNMFRGLVMEERMHLFVLNRCLDLLRLRG